MARETMADLIDYVRTLINDPDGEALKDKDVEWALDRTRVHYRYAPLTPEPEYPNRVSTYLIFHAPDTGWETDYEITDGQYEPVEDEGSEPMLGRFTLPESKLPPLYISGKAYDVYEAAASLCEMWAQAIILDFDFSADGATFSRSQKAKGLREMARVFRAQAKPVRAGLLRPDENG